MNRKAFLRQMGVLGIGSLAGSSLLSSCDPKYDFFEDLNVNFSGKVLIIGAGAAGLTAGYAFQQNGIAFEIIEASDRFGGRVKKAENFVDFGVDLGGEWLHTHPSILAKLLNSPGQSSYMDIINYTPETLHFWSDGKLKKRNFYTNFYGEWKFKNTTWFDFFDQYMVPSIRDNIVLNSPVESIDYSGDAVQVTNTDGQTFDGDRVIVTVPLTMLKNGSINFFPPLSEEKEEALGQVEMPDGIKAFVEMDMDFYPDVTVVGGTWNYLTSDGDRLYYDAAFRKESETNLLGLFSVGPKATPFTSLDSEEDILNYLIDELDEIFDGKASNHYVQHRIQNWSAEPFIRGSYSNYNNCDALEILKKSIDDKVYFAGEAYTSESQATVHGAAETGWAAVRSILDKS